MNHQEVKAMVESMGHKLQVDELGGMVPLYDTGGQVVVSLDSTTRLPKGYLLVDRAVLKTVEGERIRLPMHEEISPGMVRLLCKKAGPEERVFMAYSYSDKIGLMVIQGQDW